MMSLNLLLFLFETKGTLQQEAPHTRVIVFNTAYILLQQFTVISLEQYIHSALAPRLHTSPYASFKLNKHLTLLCSLIDFI